MKPFSLRRSKRFTIDGKFALFARFILSYIVILMIPLCFTGIFLYQRFSETLYKEVENATLVTVSQTLDTVQTRLKEFDNVAVQLTQNSSVSPSLFAQDVDLLPEFDFYKISRELKNMRTANTFIDNIYLYYRNSDVVVSADSKYSFSMFYNVFSPAGMPEAKLKELLDHSSEKQVLPVEVMDGLNSKQDRIVYFKPLPVADTTHKAMLMITMDAQNINKMMSLILGNYSGSMYITDTIGRVVNSISNDGNVLEAGELKALTGKNKDGVYYRNINGKEKIISYIKSESTGWACISVLDSGGVLSKVNATKVLVLILFVLSVLIGIALAYYFSYRHYNPIRKIADSIYKYRENEEQGQEGYKHELDLIDKVMTTIISKDKDLRSSMDRYQSVVQADFFRRLLKGEYRDRQAALEISEFTGLKLSSGPFAVMLFHIDAAESLVQESNEPLLGLYRFSIANVAKEMCESQAVGHTVDISIDRVALVLDFGEKEAVQEETLLAMAQSTKDFFEKRFKITLTIGIGNVCQNLMEISKSSMEAQSALEYRMVKGGNTVILFQQIVTGSTERHFYTLQHEQKILDCLKQGDFEGIREVLDQVIHRIEHSPTSISMAQCIYFEIVNTAMKALAELEPDDYNEIIRRANTLPAFLQCKTLQEVYKQTVSFYQSICEHISMSKVREQSDFKQEVIEFVKANCCDRNLSLGYLADKFDVSQSYLSRFFKNQLETSFVDYLHALRLARAKPLLMHTGRSIAEIAEDCGYSDSHSLIRVFRKYEGITPGRFKEMYGSKSS
ncbi:helix-turn-helix domain-containing protein [Paenibacillus piri]|uniref:Helix-turn-helix domain-containing protein n=1 Tax=Paenibacillus piri TaxID=2547395 RepID=A0A4R5KWT9_9BACL|nr:helix-turn-helix domain-containing protein [Paenibacillus piri]TDF99507.1 helix-turn-helix domain-containing protein [Paenibacillus piri]